MGNDPNVFAPQHVTDVERAARLKDDLQISICRLIADFEDRTGLQVTSVRLGRDLQVARRDMVMLPRTKISKVDVTVEL